MEVLGLVKVYPIDILPKDTREKLLVSLFKLTFNRQTSVRLCIYTIIGDFTTTWSSCGLLDTALAILVLSLGDQHRPWYFIDGIVS